MPRWFNTAGPCRPDVHYMLPVLRRMPEVRRLIEQQTYFVVHAPRQVGKTTTLMALARELTDEGRFVALLVSMEVGAPFPDDPGRAEAAMLASWQRDARFFLPPALQPPPWPDGAAGQRVGDALSTWAVAAPRPVIVFLDEIDALRDTTLLSVLRQLRDGYRSRPTGFPWSLCLIGLRDVRDYKIGNGDRDHLGTASPFNIKVESITLRDFTRDEVAELYQQHTDDTGQLFQGEAIDRAFELTQGQPWLVNALARQLVEKVVPDPRQPIERHHVDTAKEILIERQDTHLDSLAERLRDPRIRPIIEPMLAGGTLGDLPADDRRFAQDLGLVRRDGQGGLVVANPIYREVIARSLAEGPRDSLPHITPTWLTADGRLDPAQLCGAFLDFGRQHGEPLLAAAPYHEVAAQLVLMAFLHRVVNGGGTIEREYAIGRGRIDLCARFAGDTLAMELKVWRDREPDPLVAGLAQLDGYLAGLGLDTGWLVVFDRRSGQPPIAERTSAGAATTPAGRTVTVIRA